ncbi:MAG: Gfo/Idh/MocA family oxidoreductase [Pirellulales bacterium]|nr:Gfo/Idh/MocA family oxidoreductase [Pirellulales bacterium]
MNQLTRRRFVKRLAGAAAAGAVSLTAKRTAARAPGANDAIGVAVVGLNGRGQTHLRMIAATKGLRLAGLCDVDSAVLEANARKAREQGSNVVAESDVRKLLDRNDVDAVTIATPNHWHSLIGIWACQAGKDVYIEKPVSHHLWEGRQLVNAASKHERIVQTGTQARANPDVLDALAWLRAGNLGAIRYAHGMCYKPRMSIGKFGRGEIPPDLDYDRWTGPAPLKPLARKNLHYDWHWFHDYGNGDLGNQGIHEMDLARWFLGHAGLSTRVMSVGARLGYDDDGETPNTQLAWHTYDGPPIVFEVRGLPKSREHQANASLWGRSMDAPAGFRGGRTIGVIVFCEGGKLVIDDGGEALVAMDLQDKVIRRFEKRDPDRGIGWPKGDRFIFENWLSAMHSRRRQDLAADVLEGHTSSALCHMGMISCRLGRATPPGEILDRLESEPLAAEQFAAMKEHLERNGVDLAQDRLALGPSLAFDPHREQFVDDSAANGLLRRKDREPYIVPEV